MLVFIIFPDAGASESTNSTLGQMCNVSSDCASLLNGMCDNDTHTCQCAANYIRDSQGECISTGAEPHGRCNSDADCVMVGSSECHQGWCRCTIDFVPRSTSVCVPKAKVIGDMCSVREQCLSGFSGVRCRLSSATCECRDGYLMVTSHICLTPAEHLGDLCDAHLQCQAVDPDALCLEAGVNELGMGISRCACNDRTVANGDQCDWLPG